MTGRDRRIGVALVLLAMLGLSASTDAAENDGLFPATSPLRPEAIRQSLARQGWRPRHVDDDFPSVEEMAGARTWRYEARKKPHLRLLLQILRLDDSATPETVAALLDRDGHHHSEGAAIRVVGDFAVVLTFEDEIQGRTLLGRLAKGNLSQRDLETRLGALGYQTSCRQGEDGHHADCCFGKPGESGGLSVEYWDGRVWCWGDSCKGKNLLVRQGKSGVGIKIAASIAHRVESERILSRLFPARADDLSQAKELLRAQKYSEAMTLLQKPEATPEERYELARALSLHRSTHPCEALLESVRDALASALERSARLRKMARAEPGFRELHGTCMFQRLAYGLDMANPGHLRLLLERVAWEGTNWGSSSPGPQDSITLGRGKVSLSAQRVFDGCPIEGTYDLKGRLLHINGVCKLPGKSATPVRLKLRLDPEACSLSTEDGTRLFGDTPDECNT